MIWHLLQVAQSLNCHVLVVLIRYRPLTLIHGLSHKRGVYHRLLPRVLSDTMMHVALIWQ